jgi:hypothetical protein
MTLPKIGTTFAGMTAFNSLSTPVPECGKTNFFPYAQRVIMASGVQIGRGFPRVEMTWKALTRAQRDILKTFQGGGTADVYVYIPTNDSNQAYANYKGKMAWPTTETWNAKDVIYDFTIAINHLIAVSS